jgi:nitrite reductase/ring-hydroxylating ferredoxin subunit
VIENFGAVAVARVGDEYFAVQDRCPHSEASLSEGFIEDGRLVCPLHFAEFDLEDGTAHNAPKGCPNAQAYRIEIDRGEFFISLPAPITAPTSALDGRPSSHE